jgi:hypothetical protein
MPAAEARHGKEWDPGGFARALWRDTRVLGLRIRAAWLKLLARRSTSMPVKAKQRGAVPRAAHGMIQSRRASWRKVFLALSAVFLLAGSESWAQTPGMTGWNPYKNNEAIWNRMDKCRQQAQKQFPDYTPESSAKRDRATQLCLASQNLPPVRPLGPLPPQTENSGSSR